MRGLVFFGFAEPFANVDQNSEDFSEQRFEVLSSRVVRRCHAIENSSRPGDLVCDLFLGSGSTPVACERTGRVCYGVEIDPHYASIVIARWESFTGSKAERLQ
jgi:adenine specific DNA methylase Mod